VSDAKKATELNPNNQSAKDNLFIALQSKQQNTETKESNTNSKKQKNPSVPWQTNDSTTSSSSSSSASSSSTTTTTTTLFIENVLLNENSQTDTTGERDSLEMKNLPQNTAVSVKPRTNNNSSRSRSISPKKSSSTQQQQQPMDSQGYAVCFFFFSSSRGPCFCFQSHPLFFVLLFFSFVS
jgi:hypothetical protein